RAAWDGPPSWLAVGPAHACRLRGAPRRVVRVPRAALVRRGFVPAPAELLTRLGERIDGLLERVRQPVTDARVADDHGQGDRRAEGREQTILDEIFSRFLADESTDQLLHCDLSSG